MEQDITFLTLPTTVQLSILRCCSSWTDQKALRLVCKHTLALINHLDEFSRGLPRTIYDLASLRRLSRCPFSSIHVLQLDNLTSPLPIISSTRLQIPKAKHLTLLWGNISFDNMLKLVRYYFKWCESLEFLLTNFPFVKNISSFGPSQSCLANVKTLKIYFLAWLYGAIGLNFQNRLKSFGQFLLWCSMPSLQKLHLYIQQNETPQIPFPTHNKFYENLQAFLIKHGPRVNQLHLALTSSFWEAVLPTFESMLNVEKLKVYHSDGLEAVDLDLTFAGFKHFTKLKCLCMNPRSVNNFKLLEFILSNNQNTIQSIDLSTMSDGLSSLSWFYKIQPSFRSLTSLTVKIRYDLHCTIFSELTQQEAYSKFKLDSLYKLTIRIESHFGGEANGLDWRGPLLNWLSLFCPNLQALELTYFDKIGPRIFDLLWLINGLTKLRSITFKSYRVSQMLWGGQFMGSQIQPNIISFHLENWFKSNPQIQINVQTRFTCVNINRPYVIAQQREKEEEIYLDI